MKVKPLLSYKIKKPQVVASRTPQFIQIELITFCEIRQESFGVVFFPSMKDYSDNIYT